MIRLLLLFAACAVLTGMPASAQEQAMDHGAMPAPALPAFTVPPPALPADHYADRLFGTAAMERARAQMARENGGQTLHQLLLNIAEYGVHDGKAGYRWDGEAWLGGDIHRIVIKTEGSGTFREGVEDAEAQLLYSRAIGPYFDLQAGVRQDISRSPARTYATVAVEGLAPYMFQTEATLFLSNTGDLLGRIEAWYDQRLTQDAIVQARVEANLSAQNVPETRTGAGLSDIELGLRLRYELSRRFAPYIGISWEAATGRTADYAKADGEDATTTSFVAGIRFWF